MVYFSSCFIQACFICYSYQLLTVSNLFVRQFLSREIIFYHCFTLIRARAGSYVTSASVVPIRLLLFQILKFQNSLMLKINCGSWTSKIIHWVACFGVLDISQLGVQSPIGDHMLLKWDGSLPIREAKDIRNKGPRLVPG